jgi:phosphoglycerate dehydrogenase-like enzyme
VWESFQCSYPNVQVLQARTPNDLEELPADPEVIFGNVPPDWAVRVAQRGHLRWVQTVSAGTESYEVLLGAGVRLGAMRGLHHQAIAEHVLTMMLALSRGLTEHIQAQITHQWKRNPDAITSLRRSRIAIIGYGGIGRALASLLQPFDANIFGVREQSGTTEEGGVCVMPMTQLDELLSTADHIVLCLPLIEKYWQLIDARRIKLMKLDAHFYNVARGALVDQKALLTALREKRIAGAALDVFEEEPLSPASDVWDTRNLIVTPHIAGHDQTLRARCHKMFLEEFGRYRSGLFLRNEVRRPPINRV